MKILCRTNDCDSKIIDRKFGSCLAGLKIIEITLDSCDLRCMARDLNSESKIISEAAINYIALLHTRSDWP